MYIIYIYIYYLQNSWLIFVLFRTVTAGKIYVEVERARLTHKLALMKEQEGDIAEAATVLQELQVETFGSMERKEKVRLLDDRKVYLLLLLYSW